MGGSRRRKRRGRRPGWCGACRKQRYRTEADARSVIHYLVASGRAAEHPRAGETLDAYKCRNGGWHFGHTGEVKPWLKRRKGA